MQQANNILLKNWKTFFQKTQTFFNLILLLIKPALMTKI